MSVTQEDLTHVCERCNKTCMALTTSNIVSSEFYCLACHRSYSMDAEVAQTIVTLETRARKGA